MQDFNAVHVEDREFKIGNGTFNWRPIPYEEGLDQLIKTVLDEADDQEAENLEGLSPKEVAERSIASYRRNTERKIENLMLFVEPEDRERLEAELKNGISMHQIDALYEWLSEQQSKRPTQDSSPSDAGRGNSVPISQAA